MKSNLFKIFVVFLLILSLFLLNGSESLFIKDILDNPQKYYNLTVRVEGEVVDIQVSPSPEKRGFYVLLDNSDKTIKIIANTLPAPQKKFIVEGMVLMDTVEQMPFLREISRVEPTAARIEGKADKTEKIPKEERRGLSFLALVLIGLIIITFIALLFLLLVKPRKFQSVSGKEQKGSEDGTRQVSVNEVDREVGGLRTKQVPNILAELHVQTGDFSGKVFPLGYETDIGRISGDIILEDASVSREHARIKFTKDKYQIENKSETNPVILNGEKINTQKELKDGDEIILGIIKLEFKLI